MASSSCVAAFSRTRSSAIAASHVGSSTIGGTATGLSPSLTSCAGIVISIQDDTESRPLTLADDRRIPKSSAGSSRSELRGSTTDAGRPSHHRHGGHHGSGRACRSTHTVMRSDPPTDPHVINDAQPQPVRRDAPRAAFTVITRRACTCPLQNGHFDPRRVATWEIRGGTPAQTLPTIARTTGCRRRSLRRRRGDAA